jgi:CRISPR/Cas system-associated endonuclease Cas1
VRNILEQIGTGNDFLNRAQKAQNLKERMNVDAKILNKYWQTEFNNI